MESREPLGFATRVGFDDAAGGPIEEFGFRHLPVASVVAPFGSLRRKHFLHAIKDFIRGRK